MKRRFDLAVLAATLFALFAGDVWSADPVAPAEKPPVIVLPPDEKPVGIQQFDPTVMKAREVPYHVSLVKAPEAWAKNPLARGKGIKVAVVDTGIQADHPGFDGMVKGVYNAITKKEGASAGADGNGHGTHCAGIVHAILPEAELYACKGLSDQGSGSVADLAHAIDYAVTVFKVDVVSCSFGGSGTDSYLQPAIQRALAAGVIVVCAAGNDGGPRDTEGYPGRYPESISVAACDSNRQLASFSSWGPNVFTADPGVDVLSLLPGTREGKMSGTSMACPVETGKVGSWINSNAIPKDKDRVSKYRAAAKGASPFAERNNARGYGLYQLDKITGEAKTPPAPPNPPVPPAPGEKVFKLSPTDLLQQGYTKVEVPIGYSLLTLDLTGKSTTPASQPIPVMSLPKPASETPAVIPGVVCGPQGCQVVPTWTGGSPMPTFAPPPTVYQQMPQQCGPGGCQPQPVQSAPLLFPRLRGWR